MSMNVKFDPRALEDARIKAGLSRKEVAEALCLNSQQVWNIERGKSKPSADTLVKLCQLYKLTDEPIKILCAA